MGEEVIFAHNQVIEFLSNTSFNTNSLFATMVILKNEHYNPIHMDQANHPPTSHPSPLVANNIDHNEALVEIIHDILQIPSPKVQIDHT